jgi:hypothetical protein
VQQRALHAILARQERLPARVGENMKASRSSVRQGASLTRPIL